MRQPSFLDIVVLLIGFGGATASFLYSLALGEPVELLSRQLGVEIFRLEQWREKAIAGIDASLKERKGDPVKAELDIAMKRIGELIMQVELLEAKTETSGPLGRRRSRR